MAYQLIFVRNLRSLLNERTFVATWSSPHGFTRSIPDLFSLERNLHSAPHKDNAPGL